MCIDSSTTHKRVSDAERAKERDYMNSLRALKLLNCLSDRWAKQKQKKKRKEKRTYRPEAGMTILNFILFFLVSVCLSFFYCTIHDFVYRNSQMVFPSLSSSRGLQCDNGNVGGTAGLRGGQFCFTEILNDHRSGGRQKTIFSVLYTGLENIHARKCVSRF